MSLFTDSLWSAWLLLKALDPELLFIVYVSIKVSLVSTILAGAIGAPLGFLIAFYEFSLKRLLIVVFNTLLAIPTVVVGLLVYAFISRRGILGPLDLLYTQTAIMIGQTILAIPIVTTLVIAAIGRIDERYHKTAMTLGADRLHTALVVFREARFAVMAAIMASFGRVIAEVGVSMMLGGNIKGFTRTMTTAMALEYDKGEFALAVALGIVLLMISFGLNIALGLVQGRMRS